MATAVKKTVKSTQAWICTKCGNRRGSSTKPQDFGCTKAANKLHSWKKAN